MLAKIIGFIPGGLPVALGLTAIVGAGGALAVDNALFHGPQIKKLNDQHTADAKQIGALNGALALSNAAVLIERDLRKKMGDHEARATETEAGACSAQVAASRKRGIEIGTALCERRHRQ